MVAHVMLAAVQSGVTSDLALCLNRIKYSPFFLPSFFPGSVTHKCQGLCCARFSVITTNVGVSVVSTAVGSPCTKLYIHVLPSRIFFLPLHAGDVISFLVPFLGSCISGRYSAC